MPEEREFFTESSPGSSSGVTPPGGQRTRACLVDGTYELFRAYFGAPSATDEAGGEVGAVRGLVRSLRALFQDSTWTHGAVAFDTVIESFRNGLYEGYKTGDGLPDELLHQFPVAEKAVSELGLLVLPMIEFEADDGLASAAHFLFDSGVIDDIVIASPDKDLAQCVVGERIVTWDRMRRLTYNEEGVALKFGVKPKSIPDFLALVGDTADGYPGIPRFGKKSSAELLAVYEHIENIPTSASDLRVKVRGADKLISELNEKRADAALFKQLATLRKDAPVPRTLSAYEIPRPFPPPRADG